MSMNANLNNQVALYGLVLGKKWQFRTTNRNTELLLQEKTQQKQSAWAIQWWIVKSCYDWFPKMPSMSFNKEAWAILCHCKQVWQTVILFRLCSVLLLFCKLGQKSGLEVKSVIPIPAQSLVHYGMGSLSSETGWRWGQMKCSEQGSMQDLSMFYNNSKDIIC